MSPGHQDADSRVIAVVAHGRNREIGQAGQLPWQLPEDLKRFRALTWGFPLVMGRRTWDSLPRKPLPGRDNIVVTGSARDRVLTEGAHLALSAEEALEWVRARSDSQIFIIGGAQIFRLFWPLIDTLQVTWIDATFPAADVFFPEYEKTFTRVHDEPGPDRCRYQYWRVAATPSVP
jgi:dihydrofolate reductase